MVLLLLCGIGASALGIASAAIATADIVRGDDAGIIPPGEPVLLGVDDANIYMAYGRNLAAGHGLVYYAGGERVEGFTSVAWMLVTAAAYRLAPERPERFLFVVSVALVATSWLVLIQFAVGAPGTHRHSLLLAPGIVWAWCSSSPAYGTWMTTSLMETALWSAVLCWGTVVFARLAESGAPAARWRAAAVPAIAVLVRPEAYWIVPVWMATAALAVWSTHRNLRRAARALGPSAVAFVATLAGLTAFRLTYFGYPLPNTFYAKMSSDHAYNAVQGLRYLRDFLFSYPLALPVLAGCVVMAASFRYVSARWSVVAVSLLALTSIPLLTGDDHFTGFRVLQPVWPLYALPLIYGASIVPGSILRRVLAVAVAMTSFGAASPNWTDDVAGLRQEYGIAVRGRALGALLNEMVPTPPPSIGIVAAGGVALTYQGPLIDLMGLNSVAMGHSPGNRLGQKNHAAFSEDVFWTLRPDLVSPRFVQDEAALRDTRRWLIARNDRYLHGLLTTPRFLEQYRLIALRQPEPTVYPTVVVFGRRDWLAQHGASLQWSDYPSVVGRN